MVVKFYCLRPVSYSCK